MINNEKEFVILVSILDAGGSASKQVVLDNIASRQYINFSPEDLEMRKKRNELCWRNSFAYVRQTLVDQGYLDNSIRDNWQITKQGERYLKDLCKAILARPTMGFKLLTNIAVQRAREILYFSENQFEYYREQLREDGILIPSETQEIIIQKIKRYTKIVDELKEKYQGHCQIQDCGFTFTKRNGENYAEAHHLVPLSEGGSQDASNVVILCPNHHRMFHYAVVSISELANGKRCVIINGVKTYIIY